MTVEENLLVGAYNLKSVVETDENGKTVLDLTGYITTAETNNKGEVLYYDYDKDTDTYSNPTTKQNETNTKVTKAVAYRDKSGNYYLATGMLAQTLFGLAGEGVFEAFTYNKRNGTYCYHISVFYHRKEPPL